jgi:peptidyl-prolyl cis-trans isomerase C
MENSMTLQLKLPALILAVGLLAACARNQAPAVSTEVGSQAFDAYVKAVTRKERSQLTPDELRQVVDQYVGMQAAYAAAEKAGVEQLPEVQSQLAIVRMNVMSEALLKKYLAEKPLTDADLQAEYDRQVANIPMEYKARHILVDDKAKAEALIAKLKGGADFAKLAKENSKDGSAQQGGDLGWFPPQSMVKPFADATVALQPGTYTEIPVETQFGWHVILLEDTRKPEVPPLEEVKDRLRGMAQNRQVQAYMEELRKTSGLDAEKAYNDLVASTTPAPAEAAGATEPGPAEPAEPAAKP